MQPASANFLKGAVIGFAAGSIWASWSVITRLAVTTSLDAWNIVALRFGVAGLLLSPVLVQRGLARDRLGWLGLALIIAGTGSPYALVAAVGLRFAPAYDGRALNPGCMPLFVALIAALVLGEKLSTARKLGLSVIFAGSLIIVGWHAAGITVTVYLTVEGREDARRDRVNCHRNPQTNSMIAATKHRIFEMTFSASGSGSAGKANPNAAQTANITNIPATA